MPVIDWTEGWDGNPVLSSAPRFTTGKGSMPRASSPMHRAPPGTSKKLLYRQTYLDAAVRLTEIGSGTGHYLPGPGHHRTSRQVPLWDVGDKYQGTMNTGRQPDTYSCSNPQTTFTSLKTSEVGQTHLQEGEDIDATRTTWPKSPNYTITKSQNIRSLRSLKEAKVTRLPTSFLTPGPGAYCQMTTFGAASGPTRKRYLGVNKSDNNGTVKKAEEFNRTIGRETWTGMRKTQ